LAALTPALRRRLLGVAGRGQNHAVALAVAAMALLLAAVATLSGVVEVWHAAAVVGALGLVVVAQLGMVRAHRVETRLEYGRLVELGDRLERRLEQLQDIRWEIKENEARYRDLLDAQQELIFRRDGEGRLTFANAAFCRAFSVEAKDILGRPFVSRALERDGPGPLTADANERTRRFSELIETRHGPRWIEWEEQLLAGSDGAWPEVQGVGRDMTEHRRFEADLREARDAAEAASRAKSRFLAAMSHEIRTPMNGILGLTSLLVDSPLTAEQETYARAIDQSSRTLLSLIDEILDFSKIEAGKLVLRQAPFELEMCLQGAVELLAPSAYQKGLELAWSIDPELPRVVAGDESRLRQVILNLLSNALKFTDSGGIAITASRSPSPIADDGLIGLAVAVTDTGIGLSAEEAKSLFTEFEQTDAALQRRQGGTGLGLAISRRIARAMGGDISVESAPGQGSTFVATLTVRKSGVPALAIDEAASTPCHRRVLLAVNQPIERRVMAQTLRTAGAEVVEATLGDTGQGAIAAGGSTGAGFDVVIVDAGSDPQLAGLLLEKARDGRHAQGVVLVNVLAGSNMEPFRNRGFDRYLMRPVRPQALRDLVGAASKPDQHSPPSMEATCSRSESWSARRRVLLAEDNAINALLATRVLERMDCTVVVVTTGRQAVAAIMAALEGRAPAFDVVLMDIFMPELDGVAAVREVRAAFAARPHAGRLPPIIALTANAFAEDRTRYLESGFDDYLAKPFDKATLESLLDRWLADRNRPRHTAAPAA